MTKSKKQLNQIKCFAEMVRDEMIDGWDDLKLKALIQLIFERTIDDNLLSNLTILIKEEYKKKYISLKE